MQIIRPVRVAYIVTEELKQALTREAREAQRAVDRRIQQIDIEGRRLVERIQLENVLQAGQLREQFEEEKQQLLRVRHEVNDSVREAEALQVGDKYYRGTVQSLVTIEIGDPASKIGGGGEIVVRDGVIAEINEGSGTEDEGMVEPAADTEEPEPTQASGPVIQIVQ